MNCPNCGAAMAPGERVCGKCGTDVVAWQQNQAASAPPAPTPAFAPAGAAQAPLPGPAPAAPPDVRANRLIGGIGLIIAGIVFSAFMVLFITVGHSVAPTEGPTGPEYELAYNATLVVCGGGPLLVLGGLGVVLLLMNRRK